MRCKACNNYVDWGVDERGELCPKCMKDILPELPTEVAKQIKKKIDKIIDDGFPADDWECDE